MKTILVGRLNESIDYRISTLELILVKIMKKYDDNIIFPKKLEDLQSVVDNIRKKK